MVGDSSQGIESTCPARNSWWPLQSGAGFHSAFLQYLLSPAVLCCGKLPVLTLFPYLVVLQPWQASEPPGGPAETEIAGPYLQNF